MDEIEPIDSLLRELGAKSNATFSEVSDRINSPKYRSDARAIIVHSNDGELDSFKRLMRSRLTEINWQMSEMKDRPSLLFIAPMQIQQVTLAFHATRQITLPSILKDGLLPSHPARSVTGRVDCTGNIYICSTLGEPPSDSDTEPKKETAHWWRWHLSNNNRFDDTNWCILKVDLSDFSGKVYRDIWSASGLIVDSADGIPGERIEMV